MITILTYLWRDPTRDTRGYTFSHDHVRILQSMIERNLEIPHRFVCVTDQHIGGVECAKMDWSKHIPGTIFARLQQHNPDFHVEGDRFMSIDLDVVITGSLDNIVTADADYAIWKNPNFPQPNRAYFQSSVQVFNRGARSCLYNDFDPDHTPKWVNWRFGGREQAWISERLSWEHTHTFSDEDGIYGAGRLGGEGIYSELPKNASIVSFPGARAPWQDAVQHQHQWIKDHYK